jgi:hypothetical protein
MSKRWKQEAIDRGETSVKSDPVFIRHDTSGLPTVWKPMKRLWERFPVFQHGLVCVDTTFACKILQHAFPRLTAVKLRTAVAMPGTSLVTDCPSAENHDVSRNKRRFRDFTVQNSDNNDNSEVLQAGDGCVLKLSSILHELEQKNVRILAIEELQNAQTYLLQQTFIKINQITAPYETVYHGTHAAAVDGIIMEGLKTMYTKRLLFGRGTYVSRSFEVASTFAKPDQDGTRYIMVVHCHIGSIKHMENDEGMHDFCTMSVDGTEKILHHTKEVESRKYLVTGSDCQSTCHALIKVQTVDGCKPGVANVMQPYVVVPMTPQTRDIDIGLFTSFIANLANASNDSVMQLHQSLGLGGSNGAVGGNNGAVGGSNGAVGGSNGAVGGSSGAVGDSSGAVAAFMMSALQKK